ncbi:MAG: hypothetical protein PHX21_08890 [bacterium]|nr:hypothetical protein [bacterium]
MKKIIMILLINFFLTNLLWGDNSTLTNIPLKQEDLIKIATNSTDNEVNTSSKEPLTAGLLSLNCPGLGQIYCRQYKRGIIYFSSEIGCIMLAVSLSGIELQKYSWIINSEFNSKKLQFIQDKASNTSVIKTTGTIALFATAIGLHIWNMADAYSIAQENNKKLSWIKDVDIQIGFKNDNPFLKLTALKKF